MVNAARQLVDIDLEEKSKANGKRRSGRIKSKEN
jgi:hypothetical protein